MNKNLSNIGLIALIALMGSTGMAAAAVLDPIISLANDIMADLSILVTVIGGIAFVVAVVMMMFGQGNAWKLAMVAFLIVIAANAQSIVGSISGV